MSEPHAAAASGAPTAPIAPDTPIAQGDHSRNIDWRIDPSFLVAPEPPLPVLKRPRMSLRRAEPSGEDLRLIQEWMSAPHVAPFWDQAWSLERWGAHLSQMYEHRFERPYIAELDGRPAAYVELYRSGRDVVADHYDAEPYDLGLHGAIGEAAFVGKNLAALFWLEVIPAIFEAEPECRAIVTDPAADHPVAVRLDQFVADAVGGERVGEVELPHKRAVIFRYSRDGYERSQAARKRRD